MTQYRLICPCLFGLESVLAGELRRMGAQNVAAQNGKVTFTGDAYLIARANLGLRTAERVLIELGRFRAVTFDQLFQGVRSIPFEDYIGSRSAFPVKGWALDSKLMSVPDCQAIIKKAAVERLKAHYRMDWFPETGALHQLQFSIHHDEVTVMLDTSGAAAMKALNIPPCIRRKFSAQNFGFIDEIVWREERQRGIDGVRRDAAFFGYGFDVDPAAVELTKQNAKKAGVFSRVLITEQDVRSLTLRDDLTLIACNPPYGERMLEIEEANELYRAMGRIMRPASNAAKAVITPSEQFEALYGEKAAKRRKLYNGMLKCQLYLYPRAKRYTDETE